MNKVVPLEDWTAYDVGLAEELAYSYAREDFWKFRKLMMPKLKDAWWQQDSAKHLMQFWRDFRAGLRPRLVFMAPPQHGKSVQVRDFIAWCAGQDPDLKFMFTSYSDDLVTQTNLYLQRLFVKPQYLKCFANTQTSLTAKSETAKIKYKCNTDLIEFVDHAGSFYNTTVEGQINGMGLDIGVVDDPMKGRKEANSITIRNSTWDWFTDDFFARFSDFAGMIMILTRWHVDDPAGRWLERFPNTKVIQYKAIATEDEEFRNKGEALFPEHKSLEFLIERKKLMTAASFESLYQQSPYIVGGGLFSPEDFHVVNVVDRSNILKSVRYWDKACLVSGTRIATMRGDVSIENVKVGDRVLTRNGFKRVKRAWLSKYTEDLTSVIFSDGSIVTGTSDHKVFCQRTNYWIDLGNLRAYNRVVTQHEAQLWLERETQILKNDFLREEGIQEVRSVVNGIFTLTRGIKKESAMCTARYTATFGQAHMGVFPMAIVSTTKMETGIITTYQILNASANPRIINCTGLNKNLGILCENGIRRIILNCKRLHKRLFSNQNFSFVKTAENLFMQKVSRQNFAEEFNVVERCGASGVPVYDLTVEDEHEFFANGILVHNSTEDGGDFTAGVLMHAMRDGTYLIENVVHGQWAALERENRILTQAKIDKACTPNYSVWVEQEPGSSGKESAEATIRKLKGFRVYADKVTGDKETRAEPFAAQVQGGSVSIRESPWNKEYLEELEQFPSGAHKDQVDASSGAFNKLVTSNYDPMMRWA